jgi:hypothetical protein
MLSNYPYVSSVTGIEEDNWGRTQDRDRQDELQLEQYLGGRRLR